MTNDLEQHLLIMTACVDPSTGPAQVLRHDPMIRLGDYCNALEFWLSYFDPRINRILLIENSGYAMTQFEKLIAEKNLYGKQVELISLCCNNYPPQVHYGYAELDMLEQGLKISRLAEQSHYIIKTTGRLKFPKISRLLDRLPPEYLFAVDCRNNLLFRKSPQVFVTTQLMLFSSNFYVKHLHGIKSEMLTSHVSIEVLLYNKLMPFRGRPGAILRWPANCDPLGKAAHWHKDYNSPRQRIINSMRGACRVFLPNWWV